MDWEGEGGVVNKKNFLIQNHGSRVTYLVVHSGWSWELVAFSHAVALMRDLHARSREKKKPSILFFFVFCFLSFTRWNVREMEKWEVFSTLCVMAQWKCYWWNILVNVFKNFCIVCKYCDCRFVMQLSWKLVCYCSIFGRSVYTTFGKISFINILYKKLQIPV